MYVPVLDVNQKPLMPTTSSVAGGQMQISGYIPPRRIDNYIWSDIEKYVASAIYATIYGTLVPAKKLLKAAEALQESVLDQVVALLVYPLGDAIRKR